MYVVHVCVCVCVWPCQFEGGFQFCAPLEERNTGQDIEPKPCSRHGYHQTPHVPQVTNMFGSHYREDDVIILLSLVTIHCCHLCAMICQSVKKKTSLLSVYV